MDQHPWISDPLNTAATLRFQLNQMAAASQVLERIADSDKGHDYLAVINQGICRMLRVVGRIELGNRVSADGPDPIRLKTVDLSDQLVSIANRLDGILIQAGISTTLNCPPYLRMQADGPLLRQMILEMVVCAAMAGTQVTISVSQKDGRTTFSVVADGSDPAKGRPEMPAKMGQQEEENSIALARRIAQLHGGALMVSRDEDGLPTLTASLPVGPPPQFELLESPSPMQHYSGFDSVLVSMSELLPARAFRPENLG